MAQLRIVMLAALQLVLAATVGIFHLHAALVKEGFDQVGALTGLPGLATDLEVDGSRVYLLLEAPSDDYSAPPRRTIGIVDAAAPGQPRLLANWEPTGRLHAFTAHGGRLYVVETRYTEAKDFTGPAVISTLNVYDMTRTDEPKLLGNFTADGTINRLRVADGRAYLVLNENQFLVLDLADPGRLAPLSTINLGRDFGHVALHVDRGRAFLGHDGQIDVFDVSNPESPRHEQTLTLPIPYEVIVSMAVDGSRLYAATYWDVAVFDLHSGRVVTTIESSGAGLYAGGGVGRIALSGSRLFIPGHSAGVQAIRMRPDPAQSVIAGAYPTLGSAHAAAARGDLVFVANGARGLTILQARE